MLPGSPSPSPREEELNAMIPAELRDTTMAELYSLPPSWVATQSPSVQIICNAVNAFFATGGEPQSVQDDRTQG